MRSPAAERRRPTPWDAVVALAVVAFAVVLIFLLRPTQGSAVTAVITLDGETVAQYRLDQPLRSADHLPAQPVGYLPVGQRSRRI